MNGLEPNRHVLEGDTFIDFHFINYRSAVIIIKKLMFELILLCVQFKVVCKKNDIEFWDFFVSHFMESTEVKKTKKVITGVKLGKSSFPLLNKNISVFYNRG